MDLALRLIADADLRPRNTFGVAARARWLAEARTLDAIQTALALAEREALPVVVLAGGSNVLITGDLDALVLVPALRGIEWLADDGSQVLVRAGAGESWHGLVLQTLAAGAYGLENLALIPGSVGAAPIQNIGAYGVELERFVHAVEVWDRVAQQSQRLSREQCAFGYRDSCFKQPALAERYLITAVELVLQRQPQLRLEYAGIRDELALQGVSTPTPQDVCAAVCSLRRRKLPDPRLIGNAGSFFKNPVIDQAAADALKSSHPELPLYPAGAGRCKLPAGWLIDQCGWKGYRAGDAGVHAEHALVLVNHGLASGAELLALARRIQHSVLQRFGVLLEPEPRVLGPG
ncbi:MAG: UDP-N-acetylmuramate dehydrogenase [Lysobacterales bacterium]